MYIETTAFRAGWLANRGDERAQRLKEAESKGEEVRDRLKRYFREGEQWGSVKPPI
ncbi:hypothetical protein P186_2385 [Pyrobaculum ferrireducens]|uniref:Uncharacterized protein n=1 Tax=Pyrobaculum ferrireducens TaxID=1104324 RepID=G7VC85_9CREN|nr:hypothetical protein P186_2385 [Pyrobaculum ferrireducens]